MHGTTNINLIARQRWRWITRLNTQSVILNEIYAALNINMGNLERGSSTGDFWEMVEGGFREGASLSEGAHCGGQWGWAPLLGTLGYERKSLEMGISLHGVSVGQPAVSSSTGDFQRQMKATLELERLSLWELCEGNLVGGFPYWGPWRRGRKGSGDGHLFP